MTECMFVFAAIMPHPPESIPGIGKPDEQKAIEKTMLAFESLRSDFEKAKPDTVIVISPHGHSENYAFVINSSADLKGSFANFGLDEVYECENDLEFADKLCFIGDINEAETHLHEHFLDHGTIIPLYHLTKNIKPKVIHISFSMMSLQKHYRLGELIQKLVAGGMGGRVAIVASADLSHKLQPNSPCGYSEDAQKFDQNIIHFLGSRDEDSILGLHQEALVGAAECGIRSIVILLGALHGQKYEFKLLSYEFPFGIGYMTAKLI